MDCLTCRESLSAWLDGETGTAPADHIDAHLAHCGPCRAWQHRSENLNRHLRVRPATPVPDLSHTILTNAPTPQPPQTWRTRSALICVAVAQTTLGLTQLIGIDTTTTHLHTTNTPTIAAHLFNESTAWNLALGIGLLWAAFKPTATTGLIPVLTGFITVLTAYSTHDLLTGTAPIPRVASHSLLILGLALMIIINRRHRPPAPDDAKTSPTPGTAHGDGAPSGTAQADDEAGPGERPHLRPAGHHNAA